ncbi:MAG: threonylcarbamoyl-AMP synthase [Comamonadaceae bacterium PBBC2]|nr:MAG: threonylcarbamoyl-AMP synthase [Comamonadaceae bacterium PBBC2]
MIVSALVPASAADSIAAGARTIRTGGLLGLPTETVYGLAADADNATAVAQIFEAKGRPTDHPLIVHVAAFDGGMSAVAHYCSQVPAFAQQLMAAFWPGPLTLILPRREGVGAAAAGGQNSIGVRCPAHPVAQALLSVLRKPEKPEEGEREVWGLAAPSANRFGRVSPTTAAHVQSELGEDLMVLDGGPCDVGIESTIIDCSRGAPVLLRPGGITSLQVEQACGRKLLSNAELEEQQQSAPRASGTLESHYAPNARVRLMDAKALQTAIDLLAEPLAGTSGAPTIAVYARTKLKNLPRQMLARSMPTAAAVAAHELFAVLRELDATGVKLIWVETPPDALEWDGVRDRLTRAAK